VRPRRRKRLAAGRWTMAADCLNNLDTGFVALGYAKVAFLGVVQGITELMPISSTAHMRLVPWALGWRDPGSAFSAAMQLAALFAVVSYFWSDVRGLVFGSLSAIFRRDWRDKNFQFAMAIVMATIPIAIFGKLLKPLLNACGSPLRSIEVIGWACLVMSLLLAVAELTAKHKRKMESWDFLDALIVGICQAGALVPGVSRSGSTLTAALFLGFNRADAARFSFLLGLPAITGAGVEELFALRHAGLDAHGWSILAVGLIVASISAFAAIWTLLRILERFSAWPFVAYRAIVGATLVGGVYLGWLH
jgi:undecaprenyl-diphosphatase